MRFRLLQLHDLLLHRRVNSWSHCLSRLSTKPRLTFGPVLTNPASYGRRGNAQLFGNGQLGHLVFEVHLHCLQFVTNRNNMPMSSPKGRSLMRVLLSLLHYGTLLGFRFVTGLPNFGVSPYFRKIKRS